MLSYKFFFSAHKWVGVFASIIILTIASTGCLLVLKKRFAWIQPPERIGETPHSLRVSFDEVLAACRTRPELEIATWDDIDRLDVRPAKGIVKVRARNNWEAQVDLSTGAVLQVAFRRSDIIESIHDGSFFGSIAHGYLWPLVALGLGFLTLTGWWLWLEPKFRRARRARGRNV